MGRDRARSHRWTGLLRRPGHAGHGLAVRLALSAAAISSVLAPVVGGSPVDSAAAGAATAPGALPRIDAGAAGCVVEAPLGPGQPVRIMPLGDSITIGMHGTGADWRANKSLRGGYRARLGEVLAEAGARFTTVGSSEAIDPREQLPCRAHEGHGGWCVTGGAGRCRADRHVVGGDAGIDRLVARWLGEHQPDVVLLHIGTNDVGAGRSLDALAADYAALVDELFRARPDLVLFVSSLHIARRPDVNGAFNERLRAIVSAAASAGRRAVFVDTYAGAPEPVTGVDANGLHPSLATYEVMGERWACALLVEVPELTRLAELTTGPVPATGAEPATSAGPSAGAEPATGAQPATSEAGGGAALGAAPPGACSST